MPGSGARPSSSCTVLSASRKPAAQSERAHSASSTRPAHGRKPARLRLMATVFGWASPISEIAAPATAKTETTLSCSERAARQQESPARSVVASGLAAAADSKQPLDKSQVPEQGSKHVLGVRTARQVGGAEPGPPTAARRRPGLADRRLAARHRPGFPGLRVDRLDPGVGGGAVRDPAAAGGARLGGRRARRPVGRPAGDDGGQPAPQRRPGPVVPGRRGPRRSGWSSSWWRPRAA